MTLDPMHPKVMPIPFSGCWVWMGKTDGKGYGRVRKPGGPRGSYLGVHRIAWEQHVGPIVDGLHVCHKCDVPLCVNPDHLFLGTIRDNNADKKAKGRQSRGIRHHWAKLSEEDVRAILSDSRRPFEIARDYGLHRWNVVLIKRRHSWRHLEA